MANLFTCWVLGRHTAVDSNVDIPRCGPERATSRTALRSDIYSPKPSEFIRFGDSYGPKPYKSIGFGDIYGPKPYKFTRFGDSYGPKPYKFIRFGDSYSVDIQRHRSGRGPGADLLWFCRG